MKTSYSIWRISCLVLSISVLALMSAGCGVNGDQARETGSHAGHARGQGENGTADNEELDWCAEHAVPESACTKCNPALIDNFKAEGDWCAPHDLPESHCRLCNPGISFPQEEILLSRSNEQDWCAEHAVPESACTICNPALIDQFKANGDWCAPHDLPESHCRLCNPGISFPQEEIQLSLSKELDDDGISVSLWYRPNSVVCATNGALIQFASASTGERVGLSMQAAHSASLESSIEAPAEVVFDESRCLVVTTTVPALVTRWMVEPGDQVYDGQVVAILSSPEIAELQSRLLSAAATRDVQQKELSRHEDLKAASLISESDFERQTSLSEQANANYSAAWGLLSAAGMSDDDIDNVVKQQQVSKSFALRAPADGIVVERNAQLGELLEAGGAFAMLADPAHMWVEARLTEEQLRQVEVGQMLLFSSDGRGMDRVGARVIWVSRYLDPHSRTGTVRAEVVDPDHKLQAGEFGRATIKRHESEPIVLVHKDAVQWEGCCNVVFVRETDQRYRPRKVDILGRAGPYYQVTGDVRPGDDIVVDGAFLLKTELMKTSLGAGCCGLDPTG